MTLSRRSRVVCIFGIALLAGLCQPGPRAPQTQSERLELFMKRDFPRLMREHERRERLDRERDGGQPLWQQ